MGCHVTRNTSRSIGSGVISAIPFDSERYKSGNILHDNVIYNSRIIVQENGKYLIGASVRWSANGTGIRALSIGKNGSASIVAIRTDSNLGATTPVIQFVLTEVELLINDYVEVYVYQNSGVALTIEKYDFYSPEFFVRKIDRGA